MDKNYNVDDILSEIKARKSREKGGSSPEPEAAPPAPESFDLDFGHPKEEAGFQEAESPVEGQGDFRFDLGEEPSVPEKRANPMEFTGHVRSITDKARMRPGHSPGVRQRPGEGGRVIGNTTQIDFATFRPQDVEDDAKEYTRVLPKFPTGKDIDVEELQRKGIAAAAEEDYNENYYEEDDLPENIPERSAVDFSEYNSVTDRRDVATDIARVKLWLFVRTAVTILLTAALIYLTLAGRYVMPLPAALEPSGETLPTFLVGCTALTVLIALVNSSSVGGGLISLVKLRANSDSLASLALLAAIAQGVVSCVKFEKIDPLALNVYCSVAALAMLFNALGKMTMINRIQSNFRLIASDRKKKALVPVDSDEFCREFVPDAVRRPTIAYSVRADFFTDFLGLSYSDKYDVGINRAVAPVCLAGAILVGVVSYVLGGDLIASLSALTAVLCVTATFSATFIENIPLGKLTKKLAPMGGMVSGNKAVEDFCDTEALILTETDLFPEGHVELRGIKSYSKGRIDEAILDAASVVCALEGALSSVFLQMIGGNRKLLKKVDNIVFENGMGVSAWVDSRRVLIGNRRLMQNHGITLPPHVVKPSQIAAPEEGETLYLSNSGQVSAQFSVSYHIDEELASQLDLLAARDKILIIYTCDANITPHRVWELYGYPEELITILPAERHAQYRRMAEKRDNVIAEIVYNQGASAMVASIVACMNARSSILSATVVQLIQIVLGYGLVAFMAFMGVIGTLSVLHMLIYQAFWFLAIFLVQKTRQP